VSQDESQINKRQTYEPDPARALDADTGSIDLSLEVLEAAKVAVDRGLERAVLKRARRSAVRGKVLPEQRVVDVASAVELDCSLESDLLARSRGRAIGRLGRLERVDVRLVVLGVMNGHNLLADVRLKRVIRVRELGQLASQRHEYSQIASTVAQ